MLIHVKGNEYKKRTKTGWSYIIKGKCAVCGKPRTASKHNFKKNGYMLCPNTEGYCQYEYKNRKSEKRPMDLIGDSNFYYLVGLICTDGNIRWPKCTPSSLGYECRIELHERDLELLEKIQQKFGGKVKKYERKTKSQCYKWQVWDASFVNYLRNEVGLSHNKTFHLNIDKWFKSLKKEHQSAFFRGAIDGDGSIRPFINKNRTCYIMMLCSADKNFLKLLNEELNLGRQIVACPLNTGNVLYKIQTTGVGGLASFISHYQQLNTETDIYMNRKYQALIQIRTLLKEGKSCRKL